MFKYFLWATVCRRIEHDRTTVSKRIAVVEQPRIGFELERTKKFYSTW